ncbi:LAMI_0D05644g1_1 [Lachancea mirantina]|uniref:SWR1-complex protein 4 n=1 Tax=Lachancea mirantina TaxID=1230905 RepID=A0A1G4JBW6_9SACH|nr:LAMI_0D05644g1_1 [Lachancea mirantina]
MSSSDIFDVLNIQQPKSSSPPSTSTTPGASRLPKPQMTGMQRELYNLLGDNSPSLTVQKGSKFKDKLNALSKPSPWTLAEFETASSVKLRHWVKGSKELIEEQPQPRTFDKFNTKLSIPTFSQEEYEDFMGDEKEQVALKEWTFDEIDNLFNSCRKYDLRWFVIYDRYESSKQRSLEDLKELFYLVCERYFIKQEPENPLLPSLKFSKGRELERKNYLARLLSRTAAEIAEEEALIIESKKYEMAAKKTLSEREAILRLLDSPNSEKPVVQYLSSQGLTQLYNSLLVDKSRKRKHDANAPENPWMKQQHHFAQQRQQMQQAQDGKKEAAANLATQANKKTKKQRQEMQNAMKRKADSEYAEHLLQNFTPEERSLLGVQAHGEKLTPGVFLRSSKLPVFKPAVQNKVNAMLQELGLPSRPAMLTAAIVQKQEDLLKRVMTLLDIKKQLDKHEAEKSATNEIS